MSAPPPPGPTTTPAEAELPVQRRYAPGLRCFGCGPANEEGLRLESFPAGAAGAPDSLVARFRPAEHHQAFPGVVNGGIIGALLDCHSNWTATMALMRRAGADHPPCTVTAEFHVKLHRPTPLDDELELEAHPSDIADDRATIEATITAGGKVTASCRGVFVAVKPGHPAYHRW